MNQIDNTDFFLANCVNYVNNVNKRFMNGA